MGLLEYCFFILGILFYCLKPCSSFLTIKNGNWCLRDNILREKKSKLRLHLLSSKVSENDLKIVIYPNSILRQKSEEVIYFDDNLKNLIRRMFKAMYENKGIGLSAPQVNISKRIIVWNALYEKRDEKNERVFINPLIVQESAVKNKLIEGCLSFPNIEAKVERPAIVSISYYDINGNKHLKILKGIHARVFQHEYDHLNGVLFIDRITQTEKQKIKGKLNELVREYRAEFTEEPAI
ncbi:peptide deformylase, putative [Plasmodium yoelii]|uniref:Peptide deformylase n=4 Tax=Plasmodium yoelii TaxID=5861 RepID=Q7RNS7_PLAYO|nr:peptide deformylase, putative [Plasmodium yoelii]EAA21104.1 polypeptide deformylase, putative [Plasmodium yoelii yoelii]CDU17485.1 peptide deformylase, putative [Plasmodium yoelii]VTZ77246.1 peptide deformylase, putative [Plasmodium yoelii]|eukprot:XP_729539.1 peptide deformylase, putative [Plasmodium yoelii]